MPIRGVLSIYFLIQLFICTTNKSWLLLVVQTWPNWWCIFQKIVTLNIWKVIYIYYHLCRFLLNPNMIIKLWEVNQEWWCAKTDCFPIVYLCEILKSFNCQFIGMVLNWHLYAKRQMEPSIETLCRYIVPISTIIHKLLRMWEVK